MRAEEKEKLKYLQEEADKEKKRIQQEQERMEMERREAALRELMSGTQGKQSNGYVEKFLTNLKSKTHSNRNRKMSGCPPPQAIEMASPLPSPPKKTAGRVIAKEQRES